MLARHNEKAQDVAVNGIKARPIVPRILGRVSLVMSICMLSISLPYKTFAFVPRFLFPWSYSPGAFLLWIAVCVTLSVVAGIWGSRLWFLAAAWVPFSSCLL